jgi:hypothetical protein
MTLHHSQALKLISDAGPGNKYAREIPHTLLYRLGQGFVAGYPLLSHTWCRVLVHQLELQLP